MASSLAIRRAPLSLPALRPAARVASYQCLVTSSSSPAAAAAATTNDQTRYGGHSSRILSLARNGSREFATSAPRQASEMSAGMKRMVKDMQKRKAMPHTSTMTMDNLDELPTDMGLMPDTFVRPTGPRLPGLLSEPKLRWTVEKTWVKTRFYDIISRIVYKFTTVKKPRPVINRRGLRKLALQLHKDMYTAFAYGDVEHLSRICTDSIFRTFRSRINARKPDERYYWARLSNSQPRIVSDRVTKIPVPGVNTKEKPCCVRQVIFRIKSKQALVKGTLKKGRNGKENLVDAAGKELPVGEDGEVTMERMQQEARDVQEYFVLQKRMWMGKEESWFVWGLVDETNADKLE